MKHLTALITGASDGLGKFFALEMADRNINLVLLSLPDTGLEDLCDFIQLNYDVNVSYYEIDLSLTDKYEHIFEYLKNKNIIVNILINNVGLGSRAWFEEKDNQFYKTQINLNITATVMITRLFLDHVDKDRKSYILNVGSLASRFVIPEKLVYGATKSFVSYFTKCLKLALLNTNTSVTLLTPGGINTRPDLLVVNHRLKGISKASILEPELVVKVAIDGLFKEKGEVIPGLVNKFLIVIGHILPFGLKKKLIHYKLKGIIK